MGEGGTGRRGDAGSGRPRRHPARAARLQKTSAHHHPWQHGGTGLRPVPVAGHGHMATDENKTGLCSRSTIVDERAVPDQKE